MHLVKRSASRNSCRKLGPTAALASPTALISVVLHLVRTRSGAVRAGFVDLAEGRMIGLLGKCSIDAPLAAEARMVVATPAVKSSPLLPFG